MLTLIVVLFLIQFEGNALIVESPSGLLDGWMGISRDGREYWAFTKVPFAKPPVGKLRLKNPVPYGRWEGLYHAIDDVPECVQDRTDDPSLDITGTEDCLYLNVYVPNINRTNLPVVVSVYGGAYIVGQIGPRYVAEFFMDADVILVAMNYRTGPLGFMSLEDKVLPGNFGLKDQALALQWTKNNIASFGGDPNLITIIGVSAGGASAHHLMLSPVTRDLIKGGVTISGTVNKVWSLKPRGLMRNRTLTAANFLGCEVKGSRQLLACMQGLEPGQIHKTRHIFPYDIAFAATIEPKADGAFMSVDPTKYRSKIPWWNSFTNGERLHKYAFLLNRGQNFIDEIINEELDEFIGITVEAKLDKTKPNDRRILNKIKARYLHPNATDKAYELGILFEDVTFVYPALDSLERHAGPTFLSRFECDVLQDGYNIAAHGTENLLLYKSNQKQTEIQTKISRRYLKHLTDFATYQSPTPNLSWAPWKSNEMLRITCDKSFMGQPEDYAERENVHGFWKGLFCDPTIEIA